MQVTLVPILTVVGYYLWLCYLNDVPRIQQNFFAEARSAGLTGTWRLVRHLTFIEAAYLGFFLLPFAGAAIPSLRQAVRSMRSAS